MQVAVQTKARQRPSTTNADSRRGPFGGYAPEGHLLVRKPDVKPADLRERREMLRAMPPEQALAVIEFYRDLDFFQAFELAKRTGRLIVPHDVHDRILAEVNDIAYLDRVYPAHTGTLVIYEAPGKSFGRYVEVEGIAFEVPEQFRGMKDCALAVNHPDFALTEQEVKVPDSSHIHLVEGFPRKGGWYMPHDKTIIPQGEAVAESDEARHLWRLDVPYIGPLARGKFGLESSVGLGSGPSYGCGVALF